MNHHFPMPLHQTITISGLVTSDCRNDVGVTVDQVLANLCPKQFCITIQPETPNTQAHISPKEMESQKDPVTREAFQTKDPIVTCCLIKKDELMAIPAGSDTVPESNVDMDNVQIARASLVILPPRATFGVVIEARRHRGSNHHSPTDH